MANIIPVHTMNRGAPNIVGAVEQGYQIGTQRRQQREAEADRSTIRNLAPEIQRGNPQAFSQAAAIDPQAATAQMDAGDSQYRRLKGMYDFIEQRRQSGDVRAVNAALAQAGPYIQQLTGKPAPTQWTEDMEPGWQALGAQLASVQGADGGMPAGAREFQELAREANLSPEDRMKAARVRLYLDPRASNAGFRPVTITGDDGLPRTFTFSSRDGRWLDPQGNSASARDQQQIQRQETQPQGVQRTMLDSQGQEAGGPDAMAAAIEQDIGRPLTPQERQQVATGQFNIQAPTQPAVPPQFAAEFNEYRASQGQPPASPDELQRAFAMFNTPAQPADAPQSAGMAPQRASGGDVYAQAPMGSGGVNPFVGRSAEQEAAAVRLAQGEADLSLADRQAEAAGNQAATVTERTELAKQGTALAGELRERATAAQGENNRLSGLERALSDAYTGAGAGAVLQARRLAAAFDIGDTTTLGASEIASAIQKQLALGMRNTSEGEGMPGAMSNEDRNFLMSAVPGLEMSPEGWRGLIEMRRKLNDYTTRQNREAREFLADGNPAAELPYHMQTWADQNPLFENFQPSGQRRTLMGEVDEIGGQARGAADAMRGTQQDQPADDIDELLRIYGGQ